METKLYSWFSHRHSTPNCQFSDEYLYKETGTWEMNGLLALQQSKSNRDKSTTVFIHVRAKGFVGKYKLIANKQLSLKLC